jgi:hypothetical protein
MALDELARPFEHGVCVDNLRRLDPLETRPVKELDTLSGSGAQILAKRSATIWSELGFSVEVEVEVAPAGMSRFMTVCDRIEVAAGLIDRRNVNGCSSGMLTL